MSHYATFIASSENFELAEGLTDYKVSTETGPSGQLSYKISAKLNLDTPIRELLHFLEAGGSIGLTRDGLRKRIVLETTDGS